MGPRFALKGYCTFTITYGQYKNIPLLAGLDKMENSAVELATFVNQVLASTNATKVNLVGHSEGSMMPRYWLKFLGGASKVGKYLCSQAVSCSSRQDPSKPLTARYRFSRR